MISKAFGMRQKSPWKGRIGGTQEVRILFGEMLDVQRKCLLVGWVMGVGFREEVYASEKSWELFVS